MQVQGALLVQVKGVILVHVMTQYLLASMVMLHPAAYAMKDTPSTLPTPKVLSPTLQAPVSTW